MWGGGAKTRVATDGVTKTPKMSAKKKKKILDLRKNSELMKKSFVEKMRLAFLENDLVDVKTSGREKVQEKVVDFENIGKQMLLDNLRTCRRSNLRDSENSIKKVIKRLIN